TKGGHSSVPPKHTGIGYASLLVAALEKESYPVTLPDKNPLLATTRCYVENAPNPNPELKWAVNNLNKGGRALITQYLTSLGQESLLTTTQAVDIIQGGLKVNALPEKVSITINHRIAVDSSLKHVQTHFNDVFTPVAKKFSLTLKVADFNDVSKIAHEFKATDSKGLVTVTLNSKGLEPAPVSPSNGAGDRGWDVLEGTIHHVFDKSAKSGKLGKIIVSGGMMAGNTDTKHYWALSKSVYRFGPVDGLNVHTVDEHIDGQEYVQGIVFYHELIRNWSG
ncbi:hypothetical protein HDU99_009666, partial [Rhizoclosmatium hyalinum]